MKIFNIFKELDKVFQKRTFILIFLMFFAGILEMIGISLILPLISLLTDTNNSDIFILNYLDNLLITLNLDKSEYFIFFIIAIAVLYLFKNFYLALIYFLQTRFIRSLFKNAFKQNIK